MIDSHAHLSCDQVAIFAEEMIQRASLKGVSSIINICTDLPSLDQGLELQKRFPQIYNAAAIVPQDAHKEGLEPFFKKIKEATQQKELVAIGETGLDYFYGLETKQKQWEWLEKHLELALSENLPVVIHCRDAFDDFFSCIDRCFSSSQKKGVLHCFTGTQQDADKLIARGWMISLSGIVTFKKSVELQEIARNIPLENLLIETDTPYLAPQLHRGKMNEPSFIEETARFIASLKKVDPKAFCNATSQNAKKIFDLPLL